jgi:hypothetical protein
MKNKVMKTLVVSSLLASAAFADVYVGVDYGQVGNTDKATNSASNSITQTNAYGDLGVKVGFGTDGGWKSQLRVSKIDYDKAIFDSSHKDLTEVGFDILKEFEVSKNFYPFIKLGMGYGWMNVDGYTKSSIAEVSMNGGVGLSYKAVEHLYLVAGVDYVYRKWQDIEYTNGYTTDTISVTGSGAKIYAGVNYAF